MLTKSDLQSIKQIVQSETNPLSKKVSSLGLKIIKIDKKMDKAINFLDRQDISTIKRIERIEDHLELKPLNI